MYDSCKLDKNILRRAGAAVPAPLRHRGRGAGLGGVTRGNCLSNTTCLTQVFFKQANYAASSIRQVMP